MEDSDLERRTPGRHRFPDDEREQLLIHPGPEAGWDDSTGTLIRLLAELGHGVDLEVFQ